MDGNDNLYGELQCDSPGRAGTRTEAGAALRLQRKEESDEKNICIHNYVQPYSGNAVRLWRGIQDGIERRIRERCVRSGGGDQTDGFHQYATYTNLYRDDGVETADDFYILLIQTRLDGSHEKKIKIKNLERIIGVKDAYLYYHIGDYSEKGEDYSGRICRVPIKKR